MKRLFLTSAGFQNSELSKVLIREIPKPIGECLISMISYTQNDNEEYYVNKSRKELENIGFRNIQILNLHEGKSDIEDADIIYVCGGNTYLILKRIKELELDKQIINLVIKGKIYIGVSAGSIIAGPNIEIAGHGSEGDENTVNVSDLNGFGFTDITIFPHYRSELKREVDEFKKISKYPVMEITDNQMIFIRGDEVEKIGEF